MRIQCPCGLVTATVEVADGRAGRVRFASVPAFAFARDAVVVTEPVRAGDPGHRLWRCVLRRAAGLRPGARPGAQPGLAAGRGRDGDQACGRRRRFPSSHPDSPDLAYLYGIILTDDTERRLRCRHDQCLRVRRRPGRPQPDRLRRHGRLALMHRRREVATGKTRRFRSITGGEFVGPGARHDSGRARIRRWRSRSPARPSSPARRASGASPTTPWAAASCCGAD